jgi:hypothetical protein
MLKVAGDLEFLLELQQLRSENGLPDVEILTVRIKQLTQHLEKIEPVASPCVVCAGESPSTWKDARVDTLRTRAHCLAHRAVFHGNDQGDKTEQACISCDQFDPILVPIKRSHMKRLLLPVGLAPEDKTVDPLFELEDSDEEVSRLSALLGEAEIACSEAERKLATKKGDPAALEGSCLKAQLGVISKAKELVLARIELRRAGAQCDYGSLLGKRRRPEGSETESAEESQAESEGASQAQPEPGQEGSQSEVSA